MPVTPRSVSDASESETKELILMNETRVIRDCSMQGFTVLSNIPVMHLPGQICNLCEL